MQNREAILTLSASAATSSFPVVVSPSTTCFSLRSLLSVFFIFGVFFPKILLLSPYSLPWGLSESRVLQSLTELSHGCQTLHSNSFPFTSLLSLKRQNLEGWVNPQHPIRWFITACNYSSKGIWQFGPLKPCTVVCMHTQKISNTTTNLDKLLLLQCTNNYRQHTPFLPPDFSYANTEIKLMTFPKTTPLYFKLKNVKIVALQVKVYKFNLFCLQILLN